MPQIDWLVGSGRTSLSVWLIALGLGAMFLGSVRQAVRELDVASELTVVERRVCVVGLGLGYFFTTLSVLSTAYGAYAGFLYVLFRGVEGVASTHLFYRIYRYLSGRDTGTSLTRRAKHSLSTSFVLFLGGYLTLRGLGGRPVVGGVRYNVAMTYNVTVATLTFLAVRWRYRHVAEETNVGVVLGLSLSVAGANVYGFAPTTDVLLILLGAVVYSVGYWVSAYVLWGRALLGGDGTAT